MSPKNTRRSARHQSSRNEKNTSDLSSIKESKSKESCQRDLKLFENIELRKELENIEQFKETPDLFLDTDIDGKDIYKFASTRAKKNAMMEKALSSQSTSASSVPHIEKNLRVHLIKIKSNATNSKECWHITDKCTRKQTNVKYKKTAKSNKSSLEASTESSDEDMISWASSEHNDVDEKENLEKTNEYKSEIEVEATLPKTPRRGRTKVYHLKSEEYFTAQSEKCRTSNNTLSKLKNRIDQEHLQQLLESSDHISDVHKKRIKEASLALENNFIEWCHLMEEGFTVLLYGLGSKRILVNNFYKKMIPDEPTLIINGFFPSLTLKDILDSIIVELLGLETVTNLNECFRIIENRMKEYPDDCIYLLFNNIDGGMLRSPKVQDMLSRLASIPNINMLASIDHINAPLIWDNVMRARYNFFWVEATTFLPYRAETSYESSLLVQKSGGLALLSLKNVFTSLPSNAQKVYLILVKHQLENSSSSYTGMAFRDLYRASREEFIVSSDQALRSQLTEFIDHKLVKTKRNYDGVESLIIPLDNSLLKQFLEDHEET